VLLKVLEPELSHYDTLGVPPDATPDQIKQAKRRAAQKAHPDKGGSDAEMAAVNRAYEVLSNAESREHYDQTGEDPGAPVDGGSMVLMQLFERAIEECDGDVLAFCHKKLDRALSDLKSDEDETRVVIRKLSKKRDRLKTRDDRPNIFASLIDQKLAEKQARLRSIDRGRANAKAAKEHLAAYESTYVPEPEQQATTKGQTAMEINQTIDAFLRSGGFFNTGRSSRW
jgi:curved DNA-binding protein CbpA